VTTGGARAAAGVTTSSAPTVIVIHPGVLPGVPEAIAALPDVKTVCPPEDGIAAALQEAEVLVTYQWRDEYLDGRLRWLQSHSAGSEQYPLATLREHGIVLTTARGVHIVCAEHAIGLLLALTRDIHQSIREMPARTWNLHVAPEVAGRTVVVLGLGAIGEAIARRLQGWDVRLIGVTRRPAAYQGVLDDVRPLSELRAAAAEASILMVALPAAPETRHIVSGEVLDALGEGWVVNIARGAVIDEARLVDRLAAGTLLGAGLDVTEMEPLPPDSPLWELPNVVITPHMAGLTPRYGERLAVIVRQNLMAFSGRGPWVNRIV
jgi:phosphoglycerate dehydrogenase-like enzyme